MKNLTDTSLFDLKSVAQPVVVNDTIFFIETTVDEQTNQYQSAIFSVNTQSNQLREWGVQGQQHDRLQVSPNQEWLSFVTNDAASETTTLWIMPLSGGKAKEIISEKGVEHYLWASDSATIYYQQSTSVEEVAKGAKEDIAGFPEVKATQKVDYLADGVGFLKDKEVSVYRIAINTQSSELVYTQKEPFQLVAVSAESDYLYISGESVPEDEWHYGSMIYQVATATKTVISMANYLPEGSYSFGALQNDQLLVLGNDMTYGFVTLDDVFLIDLTKKTAINLSENLDKAFGNAIINDFQQKNRGPKFYWMDDETFLAPVTESGKLTLYQGTVTGQWKRLVDLPLDIVDTSQPVKGKVTVSYSTAVVPSRIGIIDLENGTIDSIYDPNKEVIATHTISQPEVFDYQGADGWQIQGWYVPPVDPIAHHPAILYIHGGPQVCYGETFFHEMQVHAANGYGVIMLNPRGGQGYGQEFVKAILGDYGNKDYEDLLLGVDAVLANHPEIDAQNLHVVGGSYGGFMTNWIVGHTDRFASAVTQRSISNWVSFYGTSDIGPFFVKYQLLRELDAVDALWTMSPLAYADQVKTPTLVLHGENDLRCPQEQGQQFYMALKRYGVDTKLMLFPQSSHGLSRNGLPHLRIARINAVTEWLNAHETV